MSTVRYNWELQSELVKLEKEHRFREKEHNLDFSPAPLLPSWWQLTLEGVYGMLFEPFLGTEIGDTMLTSSWPSVNLIGHTLLLHTAVLHPKLVHPCKVVELPLFDVTDAKNGVNFGTYAIGRVLALALCNGKISEPRRMMEIEVLKPYVQGFHLKTYEALRSRDFDMLSEMKDDVLDGAPHRLYRYWWDIFYETHLYNCVYSNH